MAHCIMRISAKLPWWWKAYILAAQFSASCGIAIDPDICAAFILRHTKIQAR